MADRLVTNWLLAGILTTLLIHLWIRVEPSAQAETLRLDDCITEHITGIPHQYLHVVDHAPRDER